MLKTGCIPICCLLVWLMSCDSDTARKNAATHRVFKPLSSATIFDRLEPLKACYRDQQICSLIFVEEGAPGYALNMYDTNGNLVLEKASLFSVCDANERRSYNELGLLELQEGGCCTYHYEDSITYLGSGDGSKIYQVAHRHGDDKGTDTTIYFIEQDRVSYKWHYRDQNYSVMGFHYDNAGRLQTRRVDYFWWRPKLQYERKTVTERYYYSGDRIDSVITMHTRMDGKKWTDKMIFSNNTPIAAIFNSPHDNEVRTCSAKIFRYK